MTLDALQYAFMLTVLPLTIFAICSSLSISPKAKWRIATGLLAWFCFTALTTIPSVGPLPGALFSIIFPVVGVGFYFYFNKIALETIATIAVAPLVALHITRVAGGLFVPLFWESRLSNPFAYIAGGGDLLAASLAIPAVIIAYRAALGWQKWVLAWNVIGFADFISAITLGFTSQPGTPFQIFFDPPGATLLGDLPWRLIPSFFVPLYLMIHIALFIKLIGPAAEGKAKALA